MAKRSERSEGVGMIGLGLFGIISYFFWGGDWDFRERTWGWLVFVSLGVWVAFVLIGIFKLARSFRAKQDAARRSEP